MVKAEENMYEIMHNGESYWLKDDPVNKTVALYDCCLPEEECLFTNDDVELQEEPMWVKPYLKFFAGESHKIPYVPVEWQEPSKGNTCLIKISPLTYYCIMASAMGGEASFTFKTHEEILDYQSPIGNNQVPYPYAISNNYIYLMIEDKFAKVTPTQKKILLNYAKDPTAPYAQAYGQEYKRMKIEWKSLKEFTEQEIKKEEVLKKLVSEQAQRILELEEKVAHLEAMPPGEGGRLYQEAREHFEQNVANAGS